MLQDWVNDISVGRSPKTVRNYYSLLLSSIRQYSDRTFKVTLPQKKVIERNIPTDEDIKNLIENANPTLKLAIILGSHGLRRGEICALKYGDILRDFNAVYVHSDIVLGENGWVYKEIPKTNSSTRRVVLPKEVIDMLGTGPDNEFILKVKPSTITTDFVNLRNRLGLKCKFHDTRHYMASILHAIGLPDVYIMERGGWSSDSVLKSVYRNSLTDKSAHFTAIANDYFSKNIMGSAES
jgi:integrase